MPPLLQLPKLPGKGDGGWEKVSLHCFSAGQKIASLTKKMWFGASYGTSSKLLLVASHILTVVLQNAFKVGSVNFANSLSPPSIVKQVRTGSKSSQGTSAMSGKSQGS